MEFQGKMVVFTAPSGSGKTTIVRHLLKHYDDLSFSISVTTRDKRTYEKHGEDYYFLSREEFENHINEKSFAEWVEVYDGLYYGTLKAEIEKIWARNQFVLFDIDVKGADQIKKIYKEKCLVVFVMPPDIRTLEKRLIGRNTETDETLKYRLERAKDEYKYKDSADIILINDDLELAFLKAEGIVEEFLFIEKSKEHNGSEHH